MELSRLFRAVDEQQVEEIRRLIRAGTSLEERNTAGLTPLLLAAATGRGSVVAALIRENANVEVRGPNGTTALMFSIQAGNLDIAARLLESGADVNAIDHSGETALFYAVRQSRYPRLPLVNLLLGYGANPAIRNNVGRTAVAIAKRRCVEFCLPLVKSELTVYWIWPFGKTLRALKAGANP